MRLRVRTGFLSTSEPKDRNGRDRRERRDVPVVSSKVADLKVERKVFVTDAVSLDTGRMSAGTVRGTVSLIAEDKVVERDLPLAAMERGKVPA